MTQHPYLMKKACQMSALGEQSATPQGQDIYQALMCAGSCIWLFITSEGSETLIDQCFQLAA